MAACSPISDDPSTGETRRRLLLSAVFLGAVAVAVAFSPNFGFVDLTVQDGRIASAQP
ncbi:hypothetical protein [Magnetospirillum sp. SS-4]|uniref:hypothetical protein n=1 Tax=Magnetospirillum sp. SS-4 TaxID=2681465 RepID=UPI00137D4348|nr:hypothetical protein [Magnetospirillum sp. SS-4]CAA7626244.1 hypothetical protein MTBSS4_60121 [Magnetospirillum sp. SS-4]